MSDAGFEHKSAAVENLKVFHFSTGHAGGAGLAARRLNAELNQHGVPSSFYALRRSSFIPVQNEFEIPRSLLRRLASNVILKLQQNFSRKILFSTLSSNAKSFRYFRNFQDTPGAILHFHNWANLISERNLLKLCSRGGNIVITAHDERIITGGCHYKFDCKRIYSGCTKCPLVEKNYQRKIVAFSRRRKDRTLLKCNNYPWIISPSRWLQAEIKNSGIFLSEKTMFIPNTLGPNWNKDGNKKKRSNRKENILIGIASMNTDSYVKAGDIVTELMDSSELRNKGFEFLVLNKIAESDQQKLFWERIDCLLALTRADNSPNVIWEALDLKIPVISVNLGGIPEIGNAEEIYLLSRAEEAFQFLQDSSKTGAKEFIQSANFTKNNDNHNVVQTFKHLYLRIFSQDLIGEKRF